MRESSFSVFFFSSRRRHTRCLRDWSSDVCSSDLPGIYAAGDIAQFDSIVNGGASIRVEHWDVAFNHGKTAALNMLGQDAAHDVVPYFFSDLSDWASLEYVGPAYEIGRA